ncbi:hypothetical protein [Sulfuricurvum sp.]|uniref:hypothetical protein n=2 Tax=Sulfuricurvum sp. TaxID=2025608 RepID=UPI00262A6BA4|nr:hypothetical protein [Sulfuricurvum sp.]
MTKYEKDDNMADCSIFADHKSEERYCKLSLAYTTDEEKEKIEKAIQSCTPLCSIEPNIYGGDVVGGKKMITIEYHDDCDREGGKVFEQIMCELGIKECH